MVNFWHEIVVEENRSLNQTYYIGIVRANSDVILETDGYLSMKDAELACHYFIQGIQFAREHA